MRRQKKKRIAKHLDRLLKNLPWLIKAEEKFFFLIVQ
jgi:hypothetical protein